MSCIEGKVILITGASSGFGMVTAKQCVEHGAKVVLGARREDRLSDLCNELGNENAIFKDAIWHDTQNDRSGSF